MVSQKNKKKIIAAANNLKIVLNEELFYQEAFKRNIGLLSLDEQRKLKKARVAIVGLGGVGGIYLLNLARVGVGNFNIADFDTFELANINRQAGADMDSLDKPKVEIMEKSVKSINPFLSIKVFAEGIRKENIDEFLDGVDVALDGIDFFNIKDRLLFFKKARERKIHAITSPPAGFGASLLVFSPQGMNFEEYFDIREDMSEEEKLLSFGIGLTPSFIQRKYFKPSTIDISGKSTPSCVVGTLLCANLVICETIKIILGKPIKAVPFSSHFDPYIQKYKKVFLKRGNRSISQRIKKGFIKNKLMKNKNISWGGH